MRKRQVAYYLGPLYQLLLKFHQEGTIITGRNLVINETTVTSITVRFDAPLIIVVTVAVLCP